MAAEKSPLATETQLLLDRSSAWLADAMDAWSDGVTDKIVALAPLAVELAAKAMLWQANPTLLVPLDRQHEASLIELATNPQISSEKLRTVGLAEALNRAIAVVSKEPKVDKRRRKRIAACRNGAVHMGTADAELSRHVLTDCIGLLVWSLDHLGVPEAAFFGGHLGDCQVLLDQGRTEMQRAVLAKLAKNRKRYERLVQTLDKEVAAGTFEALELSAMTEFIQPEQQMQEVIPARHECPACKRNGAVYGVVSVDGDADAEYEDGEIVYYGYWVVTLAPEFFICKVCGLHLWGPQEMVPAELPSEPYQLEQEDLGDFDPGQHAETQGWYPDDI